MNRNLLLLTGAIAAVGANSLMLSPIAGAVARSFPGVEAAAVLQAAAAYGLATAASALVLAPLADRIGPEKALGRAMVVLGLAMAGSALSPGLLLLSTAQALAGLAAGVALPATYALAIQVAEKGRESRTLGLVLTGWTLSLVLGVTLAALIADIAHWRACYWALALGSGLLALGLRGAGGWGERSRPAEPTSPLSALRVPGIGPALIAVIAYMTAFYGLYSYLGTHLEGVLGLSTAMTGLAPLAYGLGFGAAAGLDHLIDRHGMAAASPVAFAALAAVYVGLGLASGSAAGVMLLCGAWGLANHTGLSLIVGRLGALDPSQRGAIMGLYSTVTYLAVTAGALLYRPVFEAKGFAACAFLSAACLAPAIAASLKGLRKMPEAAR